jgi:hypothetical protein
LRRDHRTFVARSALSAVLACLVLATLSVPAVVGATREPSPGPEKLWKAFPLNPTGKRIGSPIGRPGIFRPPVRPAVPPSGGTQPSPGRAPPTTSWADASFLAAVVGGSVVALFAIVLLAAVLFRSAADHRRRPSTAGSEEPSAYVSAVFVGDRRLPIIEGRVSRKGDRVWATAISILLGGGAIALVVALVFSYSG